ncbi:MAG: hypothetical protein GXO14_00690 [Thermococci archaeon]|nr:hypothetical protein [Thermococci archaeon]
MEMPEASKKPQKDKDVMEKFATIEKELERGEITLTEAFKRMKDMKEEYIKTIRIVRPKVKDPEQSWHAFIGNRFQRLVLSSLKGYAERIKRQKRDHPAFQGLCVLSEKELRRDKVLLKKLSIPYNGGSILPDTDIVVAICRRPPSESKVLAIISCKTSLRERIAQACYWKLKMSQFETTKHVRIYLATMDNDGDFSMEKGRKSRNRIIAEEELDGVYILRDDFREEWENEKVKRFEKLLEDLSELVSTEA